VEEWSITGMGHGVPIDGAPGALGAAAPYVLATGISSTEQIARSWGIAGAAVSVGKAATAKPPALAPAAIAKPVLKQASPAKPKAVGAPAVQEIIENALRAAGLMR
ncbi:MAG TPA: hypothetical protein VF637_16975, partial [Sphingomicrobium sp.]